MRSGLFVGISDYSDPKIRDLRFANSDAIRARQQLIETCGMGDSRILVSQNTHEPGKSPFKEEILNQLQRFQDQAELELFTFFFSGHGFRSDSGADYLVPQNATTAALIDTSLALDDIVRRCCSIRANQVIIIIDACRDAFSDLVNVHQFSPALSSQMMAERNVAVFLSTDAYSKSYESEVFSSGLFVEAFRQSLEVEHDCVQASDVAAKINELLPRLSTQAGKPKQKSSSIFWGDASSSFVLPISKLESRLDLPPFVRGEIRSDQNVGISGDYDGSILIDYGTTKSVVSYYEDGQLKFARDQFGNVCVPSTIKFEQNGFYRVGVDHFSAVTSKYSKRRLIDSSAISGESNEELSPEQNAMLIIRSLKRNFERASRKNARACVLSVPADYNIAEISKIVRATQAAGLRVNRIVPEPTAAAMNILRRFESDVSRADSAAIVVDLGGGTLDVAFVTARVDFDAEDEADQAIADSWGWDDDTDCGIAAKPPRPSDGSEVSSKTRIGSCQPSVVRKLDFVVLASSGDARLGGIDFNEIIKKIALSKIEQNFGLHSAVIDQRQRDRIDREVERAKIDLAANLRTRVHLVDVEFADGTIGTATVEVTRREVEKASVELFKRFSSCVEHCIEHGAISSAFSDVDAKQAKSDDEREPQARLVDSVIVAGQAGLWPPIISHLRNTFPFAEIIEKDADTAVARGLARWIYSPRVSLSITDIAHTYIGLSSVLSYENRLIVQSGAGNFQLIYPTSIVPNSYHRGIDWSRLPELHVTSHTVGKTPQEVCIIPIPPDVLRGTEGFIFVHLDSMLTAVIELRDMFGNRVCWQINNFFRFPNGFSSAEQLTDRPVKFREVRQNSKVGHRTYDQY